MTIGLAWYQSSGVQWRVVQQTFIHSAVWLNNPDDWRWWWTKWQLQGEEIVIIVPPISDCDWTSDNPSAIQWHGHAPMVLWSQPFKWRCPFQALTTGLKKTMLLPMTPFSFSIDKYDYLVDHKHGKVCNIQRKRAHHHFTWDHDERISIQAFGALHG